MDLKFDPTATFYHGTVDLYGKLIENKGIRIFDTTPVGLDFGAGFYLSQNNKEQVIELARRRAKKAEIPREEILDLLEMNRVEFLKKRKQLKPFVISFRIKDVKKWEKLNHMTFFDKPSHVWKEYVNNWRTIYTINKDFDSTFGPVADGGISLGYAHKIKAYDNMNQIAIHTQEAADLFEIQNLEVII